MKKITAFSLVAVLITIAGMSTRLYVTSDKKSFVDIGAYKIYKAIADSMRLIFFDEQISAMKANDTGNLFDTVKINTVKNKMIDAAMQKDGKSSEEMLKDDKGNAKDDNVFWAKAIFSGIFCLAALFVVLSKKYDDDTKKWAFSVLTLIAGVWIGTATK